MSLSRSLELLPFAVAGVLLLASALGEVELLRVELVWLVGLELLLPLLLSVAGRRRDIWRVPCLLAPLSVVYPWAVVPTHLGMGYGGLPTFLSWLRRYPTLGPWNAEILAGIGCVLGAAAMPVAFALAARRWGRGPLFGLFLLSLVPWVVVVWRLDVELVAMGILGLPTLFSLEPGPFWPLVFGPLMRALAVLGMATGLVQRWRAAPDRRE